MGIITKITLFEIKKAGAAMPDSNTETKSKRTIRLSGLSVILPVVAGVMLFVMLVFLGVTDNFEILQSRTDDTTELMVVREDSCREIADADAPIGVIKEY